MATVLILWLIFVTGLAGFHASALLAEPIADLIVKSFYGIRASNSKAMLALSDDERDKVSARYHALLDLGVLVILIVHISTAILLAIVVSPKFAVAALSILSLIWGVNLFFTQKFAMPFDRIGVRPFLLRVTAFVCLLLTAIAMAAFLAWYWAFISVIIWIGGGFLSAEIAIHRVLRGQKESGLQCDRNGAKFIVNSNQGRLGRTRNPYP